MNRRDFLKFLLVTPAAEFVDYEKLLWIPGEKTIFLPSKLTLDEILAIEMERLLPTVKKLFERDDTFYAVLKAANRLPVISTIEIRVPLIIKPGGIT